MKKMVDDAETMEELEQVINRESKVLQQEINLKLTK